MQRFEKWVHLGGVGRAIGIFSLYSLLSKRFDFRDMYWGTGKEDTKIP